MRKLAHQAQSALPQARDGVGDLMAWSLETWKSFFEIGGVVLLFCTFAFGTGALYTATKLNESQTEQLRQFDSDLTAAKTELGKQQERAAKVELDLTSAKE